jgi:hypothetical protein
MTTPLGNDNTVNIDSALLLVLALACLYRYHRHEIEKADARFDRCDKERVQLHNLFYGTKTGLGFTEGPQGAPEPEIPETPDSRYRERIERKKLELRSIAKRRISSLAPALKQMEYKGRPKLSQIRPRMDPATAELARKQAADIFAQATNEVRADPSLRSG